jgi:hypothetical protein
MSVNTSYPTAQTYDSSGGDLTWHDESVTSSETANPAVVSCASASFCMAADGTGGEVYSWQDGSWAAAQQVAGTSDSDAFSSMSCPTQSFCAAGAQGGIAFTYANEVWGSGTTLDPGEHSYLDISCPAPGRCVAASGDRKIFTFAGGRWQSNGTLASTGDVVSLSCPTIAFCAAGLISGKAAEVVTFSGGRWTSPVVLAKDVDNEDSYGMSLSCASSRSCMAAATNGKSYVLR